MSMSLLNHIALATEAIQNFQTTWNDKELESPSLEQIHKDIEHIKYCLKSMKFETGSLASLFQADYLCLIQVLIDRCWW